MAESYFRFSTEANNLRFSSFRPFNFQPILPPSTEVCACNFHFMSSKSNFFFSSLLSFCTEYLAGEDVSYLWLGFSLSTKVIFLTIGDFYGLLVCIGVLMKFFVFLNNSWTLCSLNLLTTNGWPVAIFLVGILLPTYFCEYWSRSKWNSLDSGSNFS